MVDNHWEQLVLGWEYFVHFSPKKAKEPNF